MIILSSTSTGNGDFTFVENASPYFQVGDTFQAQIYSLILVNGIEDINWSEYEISNTCVYNGSNTFTRGAVFESSANNARVSFSPGSKRIYINLPVEKTIRNDTGVAITNNAISFYGTVGTNAQLLTSNGSTSSWQNAPAGITPGGANTNIQFNDSGVFGGNAGLTFDKTTNTIVVANTLQLTNLKANGSVGSNNLFLTSNGTLAFFSTLSGLVGIQQFTANGTYTPTAGTNKCFVIAIAGGGGGGGLGATAGPGAAGAGSAGEVRLGVFAAASTAVTIGPGGTGASAGNYNGGTGGNTVFGALISCSGGDWGTGNRGDGTGADGVTATPVG